MAETNLTVVTESKLEEALTQIWGAMKTWVETNVDDSNLVAVVKGYLDQANREVIGTTATAKAQAVLNSINKIFTLLEENNVSVENLTLANMASTIAGLFINSYDVFILAPDGTHYTKQEYEEYKLQHSGEGITGCVIGIVTPFTSFVLSPIYETGRYAGNSTDGISTVKDYSETINFYDLLNVNTTKINLNGLFNTRQILLALNPEVLGTNWYTRVATYADLVALGSGRPRDEQAYIVSNDENKNLTNTYYYWNGTSWTYLYQVPRVANSVTGAPAIEYIWNFKLYPEDQRQWYVPSVHQAQIIQKFRSDIVPLLNSLGGYTLPDSLSTSDGWKSASSQYCRYVTTSGGGNNANKVSTSTTYPIVADI